VVTMVMTTRLRLHSLLIALAVALAFHGVEEGLKFLASGGTHKVLGVRILGDNNSLALAEVMMLPILAYLYKYIENKNIRLGLLGASIICFISVIGTSSRGGFIGLAILAGGYLQTSQRKFQIALMIVVIAVLFVWLVPDTYFERMNTIGEAHEDSSFMGRVIAWKISTLIAMDHPLFGGGFHAVQTPPIWLSYVPKLYILDFIPTPPPDVLHAAHSIYFEVLGDLGFTGEALFVTLLWTGISNATAIRKLTVNKPQMLWLFDMAGSLRLTLIVYAVSGAALSMAYFELYYLLLAMLSVMYRMASSQPKPPETDPAQPVLFGGRASEGV
ncbi:MAG: putative O-glycosylation ligase, exosortase A system-associated, partial [Alphaproteobacteria bacterium]|nr:putative O-glycosylation ligase, exosortase A system-associated [Alphaproteobacteria bacterium]